MGEIATPILFLPAAARGQGRSSLVMVTPLAYSIALPGGFGVDQPRNLTNSVTVE